MTPAKFHVLLVEDDPDQAMLVRRTLERQDPPLQVTVVGDGFAGLQVLARDAPSVVLLDYSLPRMNGLEVLAEIRRRGATVPVVLVTGQGDERIAVEAIKAGALDYVIKTKGYITTLPTVISKVLKQHELARENARLYEEARRALTDLRAAQEKLVQGATLRALGELASGTAHHLNNLLMVILGRAEVARLHAASPAVEAQLGVIEQATLDAAEVVRRVQRFVRTEVPERAAVDLREVAAEVLDMLRPRWQDAAQAAGLHIEVALEGEPVPAVEGNGAALREATMNLVANALEALPSGGRIVLRTFSHEGWSCLAVADSGTGMSEEVRQRALEPFFTTKGPQSTGLGLSVNYGIVKEHGGDMRIESAEGRGTTVTIRLPAARAAGEGRPRPAAARIAGSVAPKRILFIDDDAGVRQTVAALLANEGHTVVQSASGREALRRLEGGEAADLVLTDLGMPEMTGWDVARAVKEGWPHLPIVLLTGWGDTVEASPADRRLVTRILGKPVKALDLAEVVASVGRADSPPAPTAPEPFETAARR